PSPGADRLARRAEEVEMSDMTFVPIDRVGVMHADVGDFVDLFADPPRLGREDAFLLLRNEPGLDEPFYYVLGKGDVSRLLAAGGPKLGGWSRARLFDFLDVHEYTRALRVDAQTRPLNRAVVVGDAGAVEGV